MNLANKDKLNMRKHRTVGARKVHWMMNHCPHGFEYLKAVVGFDLVTVNHGRRTFLRMEHVPDRSEMRQHVRDVTRVLILVDPSRFMAADFIAVRDNFTWEVPGQRFQG